MRDCKDSVDAGLEVPSWKVLSLPRPAEEAAEVEPNQPKFGCTGHSLLPHSQLCPHPRATPRLTRSLVASLLCRRLHLLPSPCLTAPADVAAYSTSLATIAQRVLRPRGGWGREVPPGHLRKFAGRATLVCRPRCSCATRTWRFTTLSTAAGWKLWRTGLTFWRGAQLATTMVSPLRRDGTARPRSANFDGAAMEVARRWKEATYLNFLVKVGESGGRWSAKTAQFLTALAKARPQEVPLVLQGRPRQHG